MTSSSNQMSIVAQTPPQLTRQEIVHTHNDMQVALIQKLASPKLDFHAQ
jgi:hypothetical protein